MEYNLTTMLDYGDIFYGTVLDKRFLELSPNAIKAYLFIVDWASRSIDYKTRGDFKFSTSMLPNIGAMSKVTSSNALKELDIAGFLDRVNVTGRQSGKTQRWKFSDRWKTLNNKKEGE